MSIEIGRWTFYGPTRDTSNLQDRSGVYVILCLRNDQKYYVIDVGESAEVKTRVENHDRKACWARNCSSGELYVAVLYTPNLQQPGRTAIEQEIRQLYSPPCGER
jgi:hypothetical protein